MNKIAGINEKQFTKTADSFIEERNNFYEINSLQWDEYGNPYVL